jgi:saccharopine dehydrogenase (NAD+, L-lysine-forming)
MTGAMMMMKGIWRGKGVFNVEELDPEPFLEEVARQGLPWHAEKLNSEAYKELTAIK